MRYGTLLKTSPLWSRVLAYTPIPTEIVPMCNIIQICWISICSIIKLWLKNYILLIKMYKFFLWSGTRKHCIICCWHMCSWVLTTVHNVKPVACNNKVTGTAIFYLALYFWCQNIYIHLFVIMICILWLHCIYFLYRHSSSTTTPFSQRRVLLKISTWILHFTSGKNEFWKLQWRECNSFCSVQQNSISRQFKPLQFISEGNQLSMQIAIIYMCVTCTSCTMQVLKNFSSATVSHIMWIQELWNSNTQYFS